MTWTFKEENPRDLHLFGINGILTALTMCLLSPFLAMDTGVLFQTSWWSFGFGGMAIGFFRVLPLNLPHPLQLHAAVAGAHAGRKPVRTSDRLETCLCCGPVESGVTVVARSTKRAGAIHAHGREGGMVEAWRRLRREHRQASIYYSCSEASMLSIYQ